MRCAEHDDAEVHAEVEDAEQLRLGEGEHRDAAELRQRDAAQHLQGAPRTHATDVRTAAKLTSAKKKRNKKILNSSVRRKRAPRAADVGANISNLPEFNFKHS